MEIILLHTLTTQVRLIQTLSEVLWGLYSWDLHYACLLNFFILNHAQSCKARNFHIFLIPPPKPPASLSIPPSVSLYLMNNHFWQHGKGTGQQSRFVNGCNLFLRRTASAWHWWSEYSPLISSYNIIRIYCSVLSSSESVKSYQWGVSLLLSKLIIFHYPEAKGYSR